MGLAAGQARLLTITARKSDCEFQSMRLSHEKLAISRDLAALSNEYQNSLDKTKLIYDYYGTGDMSNPLNYNTLMTPTVLNDFTPILLTDSAGRVVLNSTYAAAAAKAGIPQEGLGTLPSEVMRNHFIQQLAGEGIITNKLSDAIQKLPYNQGAGFGGGEVVIPETTQMTFDDVIDKYFSEISLSDYLQDVFNFEAEYQKDEETGVALQEYGSFRVQSMNDSGPEFSFDELDNITLADLLKGKDNGKGEMFDYVLTFITKNDHSSESGAHNVYANQYEMLFQPLFEKLFSVLDTGTAKSEASYNYAVNSFIDDILKPESNGHNDTYPWGGYHKDKTKKLKKRLFGLMNQNYSGIGTAESHGPNDRSVATLNLTMALKQFLTYYAMLYNGLENNKNALGENILDVAESGTIQDPFKLVNGDTMFEIATGSSISSDDLLQATFYDTLFNMICKNGWVQNGQINDTNYLQQMLQSGMMYISKEKDDYFYYQTNYATDSYIKEIEDESFIAKAEAKYSTEKAKLNAKEETLDLKMKNLDTEISSLTTEYDTVKNAISKNIEKSFKRYNA